MFVSAPSLVYAKDKDKDKDKDLQRFRIAVGGYTLANNDSTISLTDSTIVQAFPLILKILWAWT